MVVLGLLLASGPAAADDDLAARAREAFDAARANTLREPLDGRLDAVWHTDLLLAIRPDPQLQFWADTRRRLQSDHLTYRLIEPTAALTELPEDPGTGLDKWGVYMRAPFGTPRELAVRYVADYLGPELAGPESGYVLTHQLTVLEWSRMTDLPPPRGALGAKARAARAHRRRARGRRPLLRPLRRAHLLSFGVREPNDEELERSVRIIVDAQTEPGVWAPPPITLSYDGESRETEVEPEHARKMSMVALAEYLRRAGETSEPEGRSPARSAAKPKRSAGRGEGGRRGGGGRADEPNR